MSNNSPFGHRNHRDPFGDDFDKRFDRHFDRVDNMIDHPVRTAGGMVLLVLLANLLFWGALIGGTIWAISYFLL